MNHLAHIFLARHSEEAMLGALLGDFVKADHFKAYAPAIQVEIQVHRRVDVFTDSHLIVKEAKQRFTGASKRFAGILLDVFYDYVLAQNWSSYSAIPFDEFVQTFYRILHQYRPVLPPQLAAIAPTLIQQNWLNRNQTFAGVESTIHRIALRLSRNGHLLVNGLPMLAEHSAFFSQGFDLFFPQLIQFAEEQRRMLEVR